MEFKTKLDIAKQATKIVVGYGTGIIVSGVIAANAAPKNLPQKVAVVVTGVVIAMAAKDKIGQYTDAKIDEVVTWWNENVKQDPNVVEAEIVE
jgi:hypothetical protein